MAACGMVSEIKRARKEERHVHRLEQTRPLTDECMHDLVLTLLASVHGSHMSYSMQLKRTHATAQSERYE